MRNTEKSLGSPYNLVDGYTLRLAMMTGSARHLPFADDIFEAISPFTSRWNHWNVRGRQDLLKLRNILHFLFASTRKYLLHFDFGLTGLAIRLQTSAKHLFQWSLSSLPINYTAVQTLSERVFTFILTMFAPPSWGLARQEHARSPTIRHCKRNFMSSFSCKKSAKRIRGASNQEQSRVPSTSTPFVLDLSRNQSCVDLSVDAQSNEKITTAQSISNSSAQDPDPSDNDFTEQVTPHSEPQPDHSATSSTILSIGTAPGRGQLVLSKRAPGAPISAMYRERIHTLPEPTEDPFCVHRKIRTLRLDKHGEPYFKISKGYINISSLPPKEQNAAYDHALTKALAPINTPKRDRASLQRNCAENVLEHYRLHLFRFAFTRRAILDLGLQHRTSARLSYSCSMSSWGSGILQDQSTKPHITAPDSFQKRAVQERDERGTMQLLDRCDRFLLKQDPHFGPVNRRPAPKKTVRWKEGRKGWTGLGIDDMELQIARHGRKEEDESAAQTAKATLKEAFTRAADRAMGKK